MPSDQWNSRSTILPVEGPHPRVFFQRVPGGKTVKNRLHFDVRVAPGLKGDERMNALEIAANLLEAIGATRASAVLASETAEPGTSSRMPMDLTGATRSRRTADSARVK